MTVIIRDPETDRMIREIAAKDGVGLTTVVKKAVQEYDARRPSDDKAERFRRLRQTLEELDKLPVLDPRSSEEIMDDLYDEVGLPK